MNTQPKILALVPARGGSKSIPRKNLRMVGGKPLLAHSIAHGLASQRINRVIVTTDSEEIAETARRYGAEVPFLRPAELAQDHSLDIEFHRHALEWLRDNEGYAPDLIVNLRPTHPLRRPATIDAAIDFLLAHPDADSVRSVRQSELSPYKMWRIGPDQFMQPVATLGGESYNSPRQELPVVYWQDGYVDVVRSQVVMQKNSTTGSHILGFVITERTIDIDYPEEIEIAEKLLSEELDHAAAVQKRHPS